MNGVFHVVARPVNGVLAGVVSSLRHRDTLQAGLMVGVLRACPDLLPVCLPTLQNSLLPRHSTAWLTACRFLKQVNRGLGKAWTVAYG